MKIEIELNEERAERLIEMINDNLIDSAFVNDEEEREIYRTVHAAVHVSLEAKQCQS